MGSSRPVGPVRRLLPRPGVSERHVQVDVPPAEAWRVVAAPPAPGCERWYADAAPLAFRGRLDEAARTVLGPPPAAPVAPPGPAGGDDLLRPGDEAGFWTVLEADPAAYRLRLHARVHAPGTVRLSVWLTALSGLPGSCRVHVRIGFRPRGLVGAGYLVADLPAREVVVEGVARRLAADVAAGVA
ncbi:DUF2867 domain-containing protein [Nocardioides zeae]|uniref:DUF2867 domain-containing protein n=1 Tax=Nocardioides zeae TaxID=1457234 RepID=A0A6P0HMR7_9ACTN|nr:DUF2867 domain-containing protein [Nocardioides zeae]NEN78925.1 DUF2867 domain-containing protein [Nocardioides zeae]